MSMSDVEPAGPPESRPTRVWWLSLVLAVVGLLDAGYLTYVKVSGSYAYCGGFGECEVVNQSRFAVLWGLPIAIYGAAAYLVIVILLLLELRSSRWHEMGPLGVFGVTLFGTLFSAYLTYIEIEVLHAICPYCVVSAIVMTLLWVSSMLRLRASL